MTDIFKNKRPNYQKLAEFGFKKNGSVYSYVQEIFNGQFSLAVNIEGKDVSTSLTDTSSDEEYTLHLIEGVSGTFVGQVKFEYDELLKRISENCFETDVFEWDYTHKILKYTLDKYGIEPEYLWEKFPRNAVCRRKDNQKWFFAILSVKGAALGLETNEIQEVIDLRVDKDSVKELIKQDNIYPAYHMNKKSWITIILDGSMELNKIYEFIDKSYILADKKKTKSK